MDRQRRNLDIVKVNHSDIVFQIKFIQFGKKLGHIGTGFGRGGCSCCRCDTLVGRQKPVVNGIIKVVGIRNGRDVCSNQRCNLFSFCIGESSDCQIFCQLIAKCRKVGGPPFSGLDAV